MTHTERELLAAVRMFRRSAKYLRNECLRRAENQFEGAVGDGKKRNKRDVACDWVGMMRASHAARFACETTRSENEFVGWDA
jgi:hypothetical protein